MHAACKAVPRGRARTWVDGLQAVEGRVGGQRKGQRGQLDLLPEEVDIAACDAQALVILVDDQVRGDGDLAREGLRLRRLLLEGLRLQECQGTVHV